MYSYALKEIPGELGWPVVGHFSEFYNRLDEAIERRYQKYGKVFKWTPITPSVVLLGAEANEFILVRGQKLFSAKDGWSFSIGKLFKGGLLLKDGVDHHHHRRNMQHAFRKDAVRQYLSAVETYIDDTISNLPAQIDDLYALNKEMLLEIALRTFFGLSDEKELALFNHHITRIVRGSVVLFRARIPGTAFARAMSSREELSKLLRPKIQLKRKRPGNDMLSRLCEATDDDGRELLDEDIIDQMIFIMMAAHDTQASSLTSYFLELARHPEWQEKLIEAAASIGDSNINDAAAQFSIGLGTIQEVLRLNTPLKIIPRRTVVDVHFQGFTIPKGTLVNLAPEFCHRMDEYWDEPHRFNPTRFLGNAQRQPYSFIPFGGGAHACLGQVFAEVMQTAFVYKLAKKYRWTINKPDVVTFQKVPIQVPKAKISLSLTPVT